MLSIILDLSLIFIFAVFTIQGYKNGLIKSLISLIFIFVSLIVAVYVSSSVSSVFYENFIKVNVIDQIKLSLASGDITSNSLSAVIPQFIYNSLSYYGITPQSINHIINSGKENIAEDIEKLISPVFIQLIRISLVIIFFIILGMLSGIVSKFCSKVFKLPVLRQINTTFGALFGILKGYIFVTAVIFCIKTVGQVTDNQSALFLYNNIESTIMFKYMYTNNLIYSLLAEM